MMNQRDNVRVVFVTMNVFSFLLSFYIKNVNVYTDVLLLVDLVDQ